MVAEMHSTRARSRRTWSTICVVWRGLHTVEDFAGVRGDYVTPISGEFRGHTVWQCPPNGQGVIALLMLNIMSEVDLFDGPVSPDRIHAELEACRLAYTARNMYVADPAYADVDVETLLKPRLRGKAA